MKSNAKVVARHRRGELAAPVLEVDRAAPPTREVPPPRRALPEPTRWASRGPQQLPQWDEPDDGTGSERVPLVNGYWHFRNQLAAYPIPTAEQHADLGKRVQAGRAAAEILLAEDRLSPRRKAQLRMIKRGGERAHEHLLLSNMGLVFTYARRRVPGMDSVDLVQIGALGLYRAIEKYDPSLGYRFSTYATWWIRQQIDRAIADQSTLVRVPVHVHETVRAYRKKRAKLERQRGRPLTTDEARALIGPEPANLSAFLRASSIASLEPWLDAIEDGAVSPQSVIGEPWDARNPDDDVVRAQFDHELEALIGRLLSPRQQVVLRDRLALNEERRRYTLEEIGQQLGLTRERVRQLEAKALGALRKELKGSLGLVRESAPPPIHEVEVEALVATLPADERMVLERRCSGATGVASPLREVAQALGRSEAWVALTELRAREQLRRILGTPHADLYLSAKTTST